LPQGSLLSTIFFDLYNNYLLTARNATELQFQRQQTILITIEVKLIWARINFTKLYFIPLSSSHYNKINFILRYKYLIKLPKIKIYYNIFFEGNEINFYEELICTEEEF
jgi:hypothetical protein